MMSGQLILSGKPFNTFSMSSQSFQRQDDQEVDAHLFMFLSSPKQTKCTLKNDVIVTVSMKRSFLVAHDFDIRIFLMSGQLILSGKPFNTFSMARLKILQLHLPLSPLSNTTKDPTISILATEFSFKFFSIEKN
jgi:hypothetical protein